MPSENANENEIEREKERERDGPNERNMESFALGRKSVFQQK